MRNYITFAKTEALLHTAINLRGQTVKDIPTATGIKADTLYKWKTISVHLSPSKADALLQYFIQYGPQRLAFAETILTANNI